MKKSSKSNRSNLKSVNSKSMSSSIMVGTRNGGQVIPVRHHERLDHVACPQATWSYLLHPSDLGTFTWLPAVALRYELYRVVGFEVQYIPSVTELASGTIHMAIDYDALDSPTNDPSRMSNYTSYVQSKISKSCTLKAIPAQANRVPWHYTNRPVSPVVYDLKMYSFGNLQVLTEGDAHATVGQLMMSYCFEFTSPTIEEPAEQNISMLAQDVGIQVEQTIDKYLPLGSQVKSVTASGEAILEYLGEQAKTFSLKDHGDLALLAPVFRALKEGSFAIAMDRVGEAPKTSFGNRELLGPILGIIRAASGGSNLIDERDDTGVTDQRFSDAEIVGATDTTMILPSYRELLLRKGDLLSPFTWHSGSLYNSGTYGGHTALHIFSKGAEGGDLLSNRGCRVGRRSFRTETVEMVPLNGLKSLTSKTSSSLKRGKSDVITTGPNGSGVSSSSDVATNSGVPDPKLIVQLPEISDNLRKLENLLKAKGLSLVDLDLDDCKVL